MLDASLVAYHGNQDVRPTALFEPRYDKDLAKGMEIAGMWIADKFIEGRDETVSRLFCLCHTDRQYDIPASPYGKYRDHIPMVG